MAGPLVEYMPAIGALATLISALSAAGGLWFVSKRKSDAEAELSRAQARKANSEVDAGIIDRLSAEVSRLTAIVEVLRQDVALCESEREKDRLDCKLQIDELLQQVAEQRDQQAAMRERLDEADDLNLHQQQQIRDIIAGLENYKITPTDLGFPPDLTEWPK